jgi:hypothetical protein
MDKLVFVFRRKPGATREAFHDHYLTVHSGLGLKHKQGLLGYTVNLLQTEADFDALTEIWNPSSDEFLGAATNVGEGAEAIVADHLSFMGPQDTYAVEERIVKDGALTSPLGSATPGVKRVTFHRRGEPLPEPAAGAHRVVDNVVSRMILRGDRFVDDAHPADDVAVIRTSWATSADDLDAAGSDAVLVNEYRFRTVV